MDIYIVDAFANQPFSGNPAGVCLLDTAPSHEWMQQVAREMNLSETAFVLREAQGRYRLRWFTPEAEVDLCGHATLASAHVLWEQNLCLEAEISFLTKSGLLTAKKDHDWIHLNFPQELASECPAPPELIEGLGVPYRYVGKNRMDYLIEVEDEAVVRNLQPNYALWRQVNCRGIIVTSASADRAYDCVSRCFYPALGVNEDPVTGSAHCSIGPYWMQKWNRSTLHALQVSARQGALQLALDKERIIISGQAVTTLRGKIVGFD